MKVKTLKGVDTSHWLLRMETIIIMDSFECSYEYVMLHDLAYTDVVS